MFWQRRRTKKLHQYEQQEARERFEQNESTGKEIYSRIAKLKDVSRDNLPHEVLMLYRDAKHQSQLIRTSIKDRTGYNFDFGGMAGGDLATYLAEDAACALRDHVTNPQTFLEVMSEQLPDVHFKIEQQDAISMIAAMIREQRLEGILEGLRIAGVLNEAPRRQRYMRKGERPEPT